MLQLQEESGVGTFIATICNSVFAVFVYLYSSREENLVSDWLGHSLLDPMQLGDIQ